MHTVASSSARRDQIEGTLDYIFKYQIADGSVHLRPEWATIRTRVWQRRRNEESPTIAAPDANIPSPFRLEATVCSTTTCSVCWRICATLKIGVDQLGQGQLRARIEHQRLYRLFANQHGLMNFPGFWAQHRGLPSASSLSMHEEVRCALVQLDGHVHCRQAAAGTVDTVGFRPRRLPHLHGGRQLFHRCDCVRTRERGCVGNDTEHTTAVLRRWSGSRLPSEATSTLRLPLAIPREHFAQRQRLPAGCSGRSWLGQHKMAAELTKSIWTPMLTNVSTNTGTTWEYMSQTGQPGLSLFTSHSHPGRVRPRTCCHGTLPA